MTSSDVAAHRFAGRRALITGAAQGIGLAIAERLAAEGASVILADIDTHAAGRSAEALVDRGFDAAAVRLDVADPAEITALADQVGDLDVVVVNAGVQNFQPVLQLSVDDWTRVQDVNARGALLTLQLAARRVRDGGAVVTVASIQAGIANPMSAPYAASKAAVLSLTRTFAAALAERGVRVNAVAPGRIDTAIAASANREIGRITGRDPHEMLEARLATNPMGRMGTPAEVAAVAAFLASDDASYLTGTSIDVCGGDVMR